MIVWSILSAIETYFLRIIRLLDTEENAGDVIRCLFALRELGMLGLSGPVDHSNEGRPRPRKLS